MDYRQPITDAPNYIDKGKTEARLNCRSARGGILELSSDVNELAAHCRHGSY